jgi:bisphosphoglycerate-dependent phosphoglycerate mutase
VRHGQTPYNEQLKGVPAEDEIDLTEQGIKEIEAAAESIASRLDKEEDIVCLTHSPRKRARDSINIIKKYLGDAGFTVWEDQKGRESQDRIRSTDILDEEDAPIPHDDPAYAPAFRELIQGLKEELPEGVSATEYWKEGNVEGIEQPESVDRRAKDQLSFLMRVAHTIQPKVDKHIALVQLEHEETLDDLVARATDGEVSISAGDGPATGEVFELDIPVEGDEIEIIPLSRESPSTSVRFDYLKRDFINESEE